MTASADPETATHAHGPLDFGSIERFRYRLVVVQGPDRGRALELEAGDHKLVGQSPVCELQLTDPTVSRRHVSLEVDGRGLLVRDLDSTNGIFVRGVRILEAVFTEAETFSVGDTKLSVERIDAASVRKAAGIMRFGKVIGASAEMQSLYPLCERLAHATVPVVIEGETGTGKEVLAEALHEAGPRASKPFVVFDCTAVPASLVESQLFGHERGAFTGAVAARRGVFEQAHGGTLFIDEIGDLDLALQPKLLRAIERSEVQRVGAERWTKVDVRVISATRRDLDHEVQVGRFRDDLFYRMAIARVELPPLRKRKGDIGLLTRHFWRELGAGTLSLPADLVQRYEDRSWPGNVRELYNTVARQLALGDLASEHFPDAAPAADASIDAIESILGLDLPLPMAREKLVDVFERRYVERMVARYDGNVSRAAVASGLARRYFQKLRARHAK